MFTKYSLTAFPTWYFEGINQYGKKGWEKHSKNFNEADLTSQDISQRTFMVTGANAGIGFAMVKGILQYNPKKVHMVCRNAERGNQARNQIIEEMKVRSDQVVLHLVDMSSMKEIQAFAEKFVKEEQELDVFIHNAGVMMAERTETPEGKEVTMATMFGGSYLLTGLLVPLLRESSDARIINVSSAGQYLVGLEPNDLNNDSLVGKKYDGVLAYSIAKRSQSALSERWATELEGTNITVHCMHPGWSATPGLKGSMPSFFEKQKDGLRQLNQGADTVVWLALASEPAHSSGKYWFDRKAVRTHLPLAFTSYSDKEVETLWKNCAKFCGWEFDPVVLRKDAPPASASASQKNRV